MLVFDVDNLQFFVRYNKHFFDILEYGGTNFTINHFTAGISLYSFLISQIYLDNVVSFEYIYNQIRKNNNFLFTTEFHAHAIEHETQSSK